MYNLIKSKREAGILKTPKTITVLIILYVLGIVVRVTTPSGFPFRSASILVFSTAVLYWALSIKERITHCRQRRLLIGIAAMILLLHALQFVRYDFAPDASAASRYLWYLYYVPMIIAPVLGIWASVQIGKPDDEKIQKGWLALAVPAVLLIIAALTNDFHEKMFTFAPHFTDWDDHYTRGGVYILVAIWCYTLPVVGLVIALLKCSVAYSKRRTPLPVLIVVTGFVLMLVFHGSTSGGRKIFGTEILTFQMIWNIMHVCFWESIIMIGLIPSNNDYLSVFENSSVRAQILDVDGNAVVSASGAREVPADIRKRTGTFTAVYNDTSKLFGKRIEGGYIYWQEDIRELIRINDELEEAGKRLLEENTLLAQENELRAQQARIETYSRLYDEIASAVRNESTSLKELIGRAERLEGDDLREAVCNMAVLTAYIKRYANLMLLKQNDPLVPVQDLHLAIKESLEYARLSGVLGDVAVITKDDLSRIEAVSHKYAAEDILAAYALFEEVLEKGYGITAALMVWIETGGALGLRMELSRRDSADENDWLRLENGVREYAIRTGDYRLLTMDIPDKGTVVIHSFFTDDKAFGKGES